VGAHERVVEVGIEDFHPREAQLGANEHREQAAEAEDDHRHDEVLDADDLVVGGEAPVAELALVLARHELGVLVGEVAAEEPADRADERPHATHEADDPADHHRPERRTRCRVGEVGRERTRRELDVHEEAEHQREDNAADQAGEEVEMAHDAAGLAVLLGLRHLYLVDGRGAHEGDTPPLSRMKELKASGGMTRISVSM